MINFTGRFTVEKSGNWGGNPYERQIKTKDEIKDKYNSAIEEMRANRDASLAMWDYMNSKAVQNKMAKIGSDITLYVPEPCELKPAYVDCYFMGETVKATPSRSVNRREVSDLLNRTIQCEKEFSANEDDYEE